MRKLIVVTAVLAALCLTPPAAQAGNPISDLVRSIKSCIAQSWTCPVFTQSMMSDPLGIGQGYGGRKRGRTGGGGWTPTNPGSPGGAVPGGTR